MKRMLKIFWEVTLKQSSFIIFAALAVWAYRSGQHDSGLLYWIFACTQLIIAEIKDKK